MKLLIAMGAALVLLMVTTGCSGSKTVTTPGGTAKVTETGGGKGTVEMEAMGQKVKAEYSTGKVPDDFPKDIPIYAAYKNVIAADTKMSRGVHLFSNDAMAAIAAFYEKELPAQGWKVDPVQRLADRTEFNGKKGNRMLVVSILDKGSDRSVSLTQLNL
jgi:hypothetical protein